MRRVSAMTTAPRAPSARSSHRKVNRSWPGVPNRYRTTFWSRVMRPKSSATVVVVLSGSPEVSSTPSDVSVMDASVTSGSISEIAPMRVVLPTPKPPLTTILTAVGGTATAGAFCSELPNKISDPLDDVERQFGRLAERDEVLRGQVGDEDAGHPEGDAEARGYLGYRQRPLAQLDDALPLVPQRCGQRRRCGHDLRLDPQ